MGIVRGLRSAFALTASVVTLTSGCAWNADVARPIAIGVAAQSSKLFASDGTLITTLHAEQNRETVPLARIAETLRHSVVAIEDRRFWRHDGVDVHALLRAAVADARTGELREGGSTITQQYVKNSL